MSEKVIYCIVSQNPLVKIIYNLTNRFIWTLDKKSLIRELIARIDRD